MSSLSRPVLVVSPDSASEALLQELGRLGWKPVTVPDLSSALEVLRARTFLVALLVLGSADVNASAQFEACVQAAGPCEWVGVFPKGEITKSPWREHILTHFFDHYTYPADLNFLCQSLGHAWGRAALRAQASDEIDPGSDMGMVGRSPALQRLRREIRKGGPAEAPVLISGESGSGKELVARGLHGCSRRSKGPFVAVNCGALPPTLIHSELFGHERGSFSGAVAARRGLIESARGGTLFLDEIFELPLESQATLLRFLQEGKILRVGSGTEIEVDTRVIAASHVDLAEAAAAGRFRSDLYFRLNVLSINVPPLRERKQDIPTLARYMHARTAADHPGAPRGFHSDAISAMLAYSWPGNVRELFNRVQRAVFMSEHSLIRPEDLGLSGGEASPSENLHDARVEAEKIAIRQSLDRAGQNVTMAARDLGVSRMTLYRLLAKHSITLTAD